MSARREPVVVHCLRVEQRDGALILSCSLRGRGRASELPGELWFRFPATAVPSVAAIGDPFLPPLLLACMNAGAPLAIEADCSAMLLSRVARVQDLYLDWARTTGERLEPVEVTAPATARSRQGFSSAAFFSGGVDSFYTLLRNVQRYPASDARSIQHLVLVHGFDVGLDDSGLFAQVEREARRAADRFGRNLLTVATNARAVTGGVDWGRYGHGAALAAVGLALAPMVHTVFIPSTAAFSELKPWGSHPALDPLWSTEQLEFVHDGAEAMRHEKIRFVASSASALESLRVCWENRDGAYNCGRCEKCLRTMLELRLCGALDRADRFPRKIAAIDVQDVIIPENCRKYWHRILDHRAELGSPELVNAIEAALARRGWRPKSWW